MALTLQDVLALPSLQDGAPEVLVGTNQLDQDVRWVHSIEVPEVTTLLRGGELVLTVGMGLSDDPRHLAEYVLHLSRAGAVGLVVELSGHWPAGVPGALVEGCAARQLPLIVLHRVARFAGVIQEFAERAINDQILELRAVEQIHGTFTRLSIDGATTKDVLAEVSRVSGCPVVLESATGDIMAYDTAAQQPRHLLQEWAAQPAPPRTGRTHYDQPGGWLSTHVGARGEDWGRLRLRLGTDSPDRRTIVLMEQASTALALLHLQTRAQRSLTRLAHDPVIQKLVEGLVDEELLQTMYALGMPRESAAMTAWAVRPNLFVEPRQQTGQTQLEEMAYAFARTCRAVEVPCLVSVRDHLVIAVTSCPVVDPGCTNNATHVDLVATRVDHLHRIEAGVSSAVCAYEDLSLAIAEATTALRASPSNVPGDLVRRLDNLHVRGLLALLVEDDRVQEFQRRELGALLDHDKQHRGQLSETLHFLLTHPTKSAAAAAAHVSRAAFYARVARIEEILGVDLDDYETRTSLHVAMIAHETLEKSSHG